jgi:catalase
MSTKSLDRSIPEQVVDVMRKLAGPQPGYRAAHAKGLMCAGTFVAVPGARAISKAAHLQGKSIPVTIRFSNGSGDPHIHDGLPNVRALAAKFLLPDGNKTDVLANSIEGFPVRTAEELLGFLQANLADATSGKPNPEAVPRFVASHPSIQAYLGRLMLKPAPASYTQASYHSLNAFRFVATDGSSRFGRYRWNPEAGEQFLTAEEGAKRDPEFLRAELTSRLKRGPAVFRLQLQIAREGDPTNDATILWPADRSFVELGRLQIDSISPTSAADERRLVFDPTNLIDGIELTDDPLPRGRSEAYSYSYELRSKEG